MSSEQKRNDGWDWDDEEEEQSQQKNTDDVLQESALTEGTGSTTSEEDSGWLGGFGADFRNIANSLKDAVPPTIGAIGDIASFVQRSALSVAAEIAQMERDSSDEEIAEFEDAIRLPWEILVKQDEAQSVYREDEGLKGQILGLSKINDSFLKPFSPKGSSPEEGCKFIVLDEPRIHLIRRLLGVDENLAATHARMSGRGNVKEIVFWTNYFFNCERVRKEHLDSLQSSSITSDRSNEPELKGASESRGPEDTGMVAAGEKETTADPKEGLRVDNQVSDPVSRSSSQNSLVLADDDEDELVPQAEDDVEEDDDSSYIQVNSNGIASPPCSLKSVEDLILVNKCLSEGK
ncbi:expressed unknown protein [Seminavis robusta]|uniref:BSD domain-containing protein n=1 Tax=Seminavis robusta TaxID=568900 RepID=A0A9N8DDR3_9STRA|nr:expressed unknown protein [Seminavis robusta]|eukprot:Sro47_g027620.1 n/a (348) ;mRNA; f:4191-5316